ncbi:MAG: SCP2 sterol-binding domain-containing protein [Xanthomonadales bacterium]|nr:SCP2 sterol-binding domain-containing protein [Xanthomonadales bacterium]
MSDAPFNLPFNWKVPAGKALEAALNRALLLDEDTRAALPALDGRTVALTLESPPLALQLRVEGDRLRVGPVPDADRADLSVRSTLGGLLGRLSGLLGDTSRRDAGPPVGSMRIEGDAEVARRLQRMAERFDPDWGRPFAAVFGDVLGTQIANGVAFALKRARVAAQDVAKSAAEYVTEESRDVVSAAELDAFHDDVDRLRDAGDRLAARVARLRSAG